MKKLVDSHHGMLWEVPMTQNLGYAYVQTICLAEFGHIGTVVKVLNYRSDKPRKEKTTTFFEQFDFLSTPILGINPPPQRGDHKWRKLDYFPLSQEDLTCPEFTSPFNYESHPKPEDSEWLVYSDTSVGSRFPDITFNYDDVKHLSIIVFTNLRYMRHRITLEWIKYLGLDYEKYKMEEERQYIYIEDQKYFVKCGVDYSKVDKSIKGRAVRR
ncbi:hypothetical protein [Arcicella lustrica]|uniref:Uncharacterized protein n=1 Tax=Arcicella lustrica TaxID=2984196 RepID=A0ABU5SJS2_9BACT|nr:hypothetical protein [Arcicella sp. DC25W]MEA5427526.1 hypothetical protein [Arcicella sp. DC25W]